MLPSQVEAELACGFGNGTCVQTVEELSAGEVLSGQKWSFLTTVRTVMMSVSVALESRSGRARCCLIGQIGILSIYLLLYYCLVPPELFCSQFVGVIFCYTVDRDQSRNRNTPEIIDSLLKID